MPGPSDGLEWLPFDDRRLAWHSQGIRGRVVHVSCSSPNDLFVLARSALVLVALSAVTVPDPVTSIGLEAPSGTGVWRPISTVGSPSARRGHTAVWTGTEMLVWGGHAQGGELGDGAAYNPATDTWRSLRVAGTPSPREYELSPDALTPAVVLDQPWVDVILSGAVRAEQLRSNLTAMDVVVDDRLRARLGALARPPQQYWSERARLPWT